MGDFVNDLKLRKMTPKDFPNVENLCRTVRFDIGIHNLELYFRTSPNTWEVVENEKGDIIAMAGANEALGNGMTYGYMLIVDDNYRNQGVSRLFGRPWETLPSMGSATHFSIKRYHFEVWLEKRLSFYGNINPKSIPNCTLTHSLKSRLLTLELFDGIAAFDRKIIKVDRKRFLNEWVLAPKGNESLARTIAVWNGSECVGYGTLRKFVAYYSITPLYADSFEIAQFLFCQLAKMLELGQGLYIPGIADKKVIFEFAKRLGMVITETEMRHASMTAKNWAKSLDMKRVFAVHEFWPV